MYLEKIIQERIRKVLFEETKKAIEIPVSLPLPNDLKTIHKLFKNNGFSLMVVGGAVRDSLKGIKPKDYDLATEAKPEEIVRILKSAGGYNIKEAGKTFPVVHVATPDHVPNTDIGMYEIATFRKDLQGADGTHAKPETAYSTIDKDAERRDLTINALFYDIDREVIIDYVGGIEDIKNGIVRTVGDATQRFDEHRIRVLRAIRFSERIGAPLDPESVASIQNNNSLAEEPAETILAEFSKGIDQAKSVKSYLSTLHSFDLFPQILPGLEINTKFFVEEKDICVLLALILSSNKVDRVVSSLKSAQYSNNIVDCVHYLLSLKNLDPKKLISLKRKVKASQDQIVSFSLHGGLDKDTADAFIRFMAINPLTGEDAEKAGVKKNIPEMGAWLQNQEWERFKSLL